MIMRKFILSLIIIISSAFPFTAQGFVDVREDRLIALALKGQEMIFERRYDDAMAFFKRVEKMYSHSPIGIFGQMAIYEMRMLEREDFHLQNEFLSAADQGDKVVSHVMQRYHPPLEDLFFSGALIGLDAFFKARKGNWWNAYTRGTLSRQIFKRILKKDRKFIDAKLGLGMYIYWRSVFTKELRFLPFFSDQRKEGIAIVEEVASKGRMSKDLAKVNLGLIYFEEKRYAGAARIFDEYCRRYPQNVVLRILYGKVLLASKKYDHSIEEFNKALKIDSSLYKPKYFIGMAIALEGDKEKFPEGKKLLREFLNKAHQRLWRSYAFYWLGMIHEKQGGKKEAKSYYEQAITLNKGLQKAKIRIRGLGGGI